MAVAIDALAAADTLVISGTTADLTNLTVGSGVNRALVVQLSFSGDPGVTTVQWDATGTPQSCSLIITANQTQFSVLYGLVAPTSGNKILRVTTTNAVDIILFAIAFTGVSQSGGVGSFPNSTSTIGGGLNPSLSITSAVGNWTVSVLTNTSSVATSPSQTQDYNETGATHLGIGAGQDGTGAATVVHSWSSSANGWVMAGTDIAVPSVAGSVQGYGATVQDDMVWLGGDQE